MKFATINTDAVARNLPSTRRRDRSGVTKEEIEASIWAELLPNLAQHAAYWREQLRLCEQEAAKVAHTKALRAARESKSKQSKDNTESTERNPNHAE